MPKALSRMKLAAIVIGIWMMILSALFKLNKNRITIIDTVIISSINVCLTELTAFFQSVHAVISDVKTNTGG